jgi:cell division protein FtsI/penicillin-binding protein 2
MANVAATIARGGVWVRPKLLRTNFDKGAQGEVPPTTQAAERVDLGIPPEALAAVREGMFRVVHSKAGSGGEANHPDVPVAGKTGTAEAAWLPVRDRKTGKTLRDEKGKPVLMALSSHDAPNPDALWYRATGRSGDRPHHSWFMGYAPADKPQIAFAVMVEYGMTPLEAIQAATRNASEALGRNDVGEIQVGRYGDIVAVDGDPLANVRVLEKPVAVIKGGELIVR